MIQIFGELDWHPYIISDTEWVTNELLDSGSEGEVYRATMRSTRTRTPNQDDLHSPGHLCAKIPHLGGLEALESVLMVREPLVPRDELNLRLRRLKYSYTFRADWILRI